jgi:hypothetical protein
MPKARFAPDIIKKSIEVTESCGKTKATEEIVKAIEENYLEAKETHRKVISPQQPNIFQAEREDSIITSEEPKPKPIVPKANSKEKAKAFTRIMETASEKHLDDGSIILTLPAEMWEEICEVYYRGK